MTTTAPTPVLSVEQVYKSFGAEQVLEGVSLEVPEHTVTVLIGASGSGKSTLLRCINLLTSVDDGVIRLDGWDITDPEVEPDQVRRKVGMVFQSFNLFPHLTVLDNITLSPRKVHKVAKDKAEAEGLALLERFGLADKASAVPRPALRRTAAARGDRALPGGVAAADAHGRGDLRAGPGPGQRGAVHRA